MIPEMFRPDAVTPPRPADSAEREIVRSHLAMRAIIGGLALALPVICIVGDAFFLDPDIGARDSLSAYYHSGVRDVFVAILSTAGLAFIAYKLFRRSGENFMTIVAGLAAIVVAVFPTKRPSNIGAQLTPLQNKLGEQAVSTVHWIAAAIFIALVCWIVKGFGDREAKRGDRNTRFSAKQWAQFHYGMAAAILAGIIMILSEVLLDVWDGGLLAGEIVAVIGFGFSWLAKGLEIDVLFDRDV